MNKSELMKLGLKTEQAEGVVLAYKNALRGSVPKKRLDEVIAERNALRIYIQEQDKKISMLEEHLATKEEQEELQNELAIQNQCLKDKVEQAKQFFQIAIDTIL